MIPDIAGGYSVEELELLQKCVRELDFGNGHVILEIGSAEGLSLISMALVSEYPVVSIDPQERNTYQELIDNVIKYEVGEKVTTHRLFSENVSWAGRPIALLHIDGNHNFLNVYYDFHHFSQFVPGDGLVAFHDYCKPLTCPGVKRVVDAAEGYVHYGSVGDLIILRKL